MVNTRISYSASRSLGKVVTEAIAYQLKANTLWIEAMAIANSITNGGTETENLYPDDVVAAGDCSTFYTIINDAKSNSASVCTQLGKIDQGLIV